ncbi:MAG: phospholipase D family protein [Halioglobus sp.]
MSTLIRPDWSRLLLWISGSLLLLASGCASVDFNAPKSVSYAVSPASYPLEERLAKAGGGEPGMSGFLLLSDSIDALALRLLLAERAKISLDVQYYLITDDLIGKVFFTSLLNAADRGVRVRLLIDDIGTRGMEKKLAALNEHPNLELRLFNPFANRMARALDAWDFQRLNRRMHNKSFTMDNKITIIGGRNIAAEYFAANQDYNFGDLDVIAIGPVVNDTSSMFDLYWNHERAVPYEQLAGNASNSESVLTKLRVELGDNLTSLTGTPYAKAVSNSYDAYIAEDGSAFHWANYELVYDSPDKSVTYRADDADKITTKLGETVLAAQESLLVVSPYFVPQKGGLDAISGLLDSGIEIEIVTNSLSSSDHLLVYGGYAPSRKPLLKSGARFYEIKGNVVVPGSAGLSNPDAKSSLHTKAFVVDRRHFFLGSFNWDPRSAHLNTELGVIIDSPEMAGNVVDSVRSFLPSISYEVSLDDRQALRWTTVENGEQKVYSKEPETTAWTRFWGRIVQWLPIKGHL